MTNCRYTKGKNEKKSILHPGATHSLAGLQLDLSPPSAMDPFCITRSAPNLLQLQGWVCWNDGLELLNWVRNMVNKILLQSPYKDLSNWVHFPIALVTVDWWFIMVPLCLKVGKMLQTKSDITWQMKICACSSYNRNMWKRPGHNQRG